MVSGRRRSNLITLAMVLVPDNASAMVLRSVVTYIFKERFRPSEGCHIVDWVTRFPSLDSSLALGLEVPFIEVESFSP